MKSKYYVTMQISVSFGMGFLIIFLQNCPMIYSAFGYNENLASLAIPICLVISMPVILIYSKYCMKYPDQCLMIERLSGLVTIFGVIWSFLLYYRVNIYITFIPMLIAIMAFMICLVVSTDEAIKYCNMIVPNSTLYCAGVLGIGKIFVELIVNLFLGRLLDLKLREYS